MYFPFFFGTCIHACLIQVACLIEVAAQTGFTVLESWESAVVVKKKFIMKSVKKKKIYILGNKVHVHIYRH